MSDLEGVLIVSQHGGGLSGAAPIRQVRLRQGEAFEANILGAVVVFKLERAPPVEHLTRMESPEDKDNDELFAMKKAIDDEIRKRFDELDSHYCED